MVRVSGWLYEGGAFRTGSVEIESGAITEVSRQKARDSLASGLILPAFTNAHTHAGDAVVREELSGTIEELVAPPRGLKHRVLSAAKDGDVIVAARGYLEQMALSGTASFWDFREMGVRGLRQLYAAALGMPLRPLVFGRPAKLAYERDEVDAILRACDGIGISSLLDWDAGAAAKLAKHAHAAGKAFAMHASERVQEDIDGILDLKPDLLVHLTEATDADLERIVDARIPVAVCARSNAFFGKVLDLPKFVRAGVRILLGTDNAMINAPSILRELEFASRIARLAGGVDPRILLDAALAGRKGLSGPWDVALEPGDPADVIVLDVPGGEPTFAGVFRSGEVDLAFVGLGGRTWLRRNGGLVELPPPKRGSPRRKAHPRGPPRRGGPRRSAT